MGAYFYHTTITTKGFLGILLVVGGSFSYALERIQNGSQEEDSQDQKGLLDDQKTEAKEAVVEMQFSK